MSLPFSILLLAQQPAASSDELYDIIELTPEESAWPLLLYSFLVLLLLLGAVLAVWFFLRSRKPNLAAESPIGIAQRQLRELEQSDGDQEPNRYALVLSETIKDFLAATFADPVRYETTEEFLGRLSQEGTKLPPAAQQELRDFLLAAEEVKFGNAPDSKSRTTPLLQKAKNLLTLCTAINSESQPL
ncbi:MAG: DUF4381 family protein [Verrucomicrobiaceae bacterium]|nr:DUF4381 family protein [Verrucomicrobiaceae bacterium]